MNKIQALQGKTIEAVTCGGYNFVKNNADSITLHFTDGTSIKLYTTTPLASQIEIE